MQLFLSCIWKVVCNTTRPRRPLSTSPYPSRRNPARRQLPAANFPPQTSRPQENNFKAVLESIRDLLNEAAAIPPWLHDIFLGYGDPAAAHYTNMPDTLSTVDFKVGGC